MKITKEALDKAFEAAKKQGVTPRHDCRFDGHVQVFGTTTCLYCRIELDHPQTIPTS